MTARLAVRDLTKHYGGVQALRGVTLHVEAGEVLGLTGKVINVGFDTARRNPLRAVVLGDTPWSLRVADGWPEPELGSGQVLVRVHGVGICGSDLALISAERRAPTYPWVLGHEAFGEIVATADGVDPARVGHAQVRGAGEVADRHGRLHGSSLHRF